MLGHHWYDSETPFKWRFAGGPMLARLWWYLDRLSLHQLRKTKQKKKRCQSRPPPLWQNCLDPRKMCKLVYAFTEI